MEAVEKPDIGDLRLSGGCVSSGNLRGTRAHFALSLLNIAINYTREMKFMECLCRCYSLG